MSAFWGSVLQVTCCVEAMMQQELQVEQVEQKIPSQARDLVPPLNYMREVLYADDAILGQTEWIEILDAVRLDTACVLAGPRAAAGSGGA